MTEPTEGGSRKLSETVGQKKVYLGQKNEKIHEEMKQYSLITTCTVYFALALIFLLPLILTMPEDNLPTPVPVSLQPLIIELSVPRENSVTLNILFIITFLVMLLSLVLAIVYRNTFVIRNRTKGFNITILVALFGSWFLTYLTYLNATFGIFFSFQEQVIERSERSRWYTFFTVYITQMFLFLIGVAFQCRFKLFYDVFITPELYASKPPVFGKPLLLISCTFHFLASFPSDLYLEINGPNNVANIVNQTIGNTLPHFLVVVSSMYFLFKTRSISSRILNLYGGIRILLIYVFALSVTSTWGIITFGDPIRSLQRDIYSIHFLMLAICIVCFDSYLDPLGRYLYVVGDLSPPELHPSQRKRSEQKATVSKIINKATENESSLTLI